MSESSVWASSTAICTRYAHRDGCITSSCEYEARTNEIISASLIEGGAFHGNSVFAEPDASVLKPGQEPDGSLLFGICSEKNALRIDGRVQNPLVAQKLVR